MVTNINWKIGRNIGCPFLDKFAKTAISFLLLGKMEECGKVEADPLICIRSSPQNDLSMYTQNDIFHFYNFIFANGDDENENPLLRDGG